MSIMKSLFLIVFSIIGLIEFSEAQHIHTCTIMPVAGVPVAQSSAPLPPGAMGAVSYKPQLDFYWPQGSTIKVKFLGGSNYLQSRVMHHANTWTKYANINFRTVRSGPADIQVAFEQNGASWSIVGKRSLYVGNNEPTMNFGWLTDATPEHEIKRTVLHEFGHALGLLHEHQNPAGGIPWNTDAVYSYYQRTHGWDRKTTYDNVMATVSKNVSQYSAYDEESIMHYPVSPYLTNGQYEVGMNRTLSATDKSYIAMLYPGRSIADSGGTISHPPTHRPKPPTKVKPKPPVQQRYNVQISNSLGKNQKKETVHLYIANKKYSIQLSKDGTSQKSLNLNLPKGQYNYKVATSSVYFGYQKIKEGRYYRRKYIEQTVEGGGTGTIKVDGHEQLTLFGKYDKARKRMKVYLGETPSSKARLVETSTKHQLKNE